MLAVVVEATPALSVTVNELTPAVLVKIPVPKYGGVPPDASFIPVNLAIEFLSLRFTK